MFDELMLPDRASLRARENGAPAASLRIRLPWYRSLPISCIEQFDLAIDGRPIEREELKISVGDIFHTLDEAAALSDVSWFVLDQATAEFPVPSDLSPGDHEVDLSLTLRIPYTEPEHWAIEFKQTAKHARTITFLGKDS